MKTPIRTLIEQSIAEINQTREIPVPVDKLDIIQFYGEGGIFDSMQLVNFLLLLEEKIEDEFDLAVSLTSERAISRKVSPFRSATNLIDFIAEEMGELSAFSPSMKVA